MEKAMQIGNAEILSDALTFESPVRDMKRIGAAAFAGTVVEYYDMQVYSIAAALVFGHLFFPDLGRAAATVAAFGTIGIVFVARPLGSIIFGHFGDRLGRKRTLVISLLMMGISTILVGLLPTSEQIGIAAPILLILLRVIQGVAAGGEFAGAALLISENAPVRKRGIWSSLPSLGGAAAISAGALTFTLTSMLMSADAFRAWGWRLPFVVSAILLLVGLYIRVKMEETPVFAREIGRRGASSFPALEAIKTQTRDVLLASMVCVPAFAMLYLVVTYVLSFGANELKLGYTSVTIGSVVGGVITFAGVLLGAHISDRIGRRLTLFGANSLAALWSLALFPVLHHGTIINYALTILVTMLIAGIAYGPIGAFTSELFNTRYRYTAVGVCYNAAGILGGAIPPLVAGPLIAAYGSFAFGKVMAVLCLLSALCCLALKETYHRALDVDVGHA